MTDPLLNVGRLPGSFSSEAGNLKLFNSKKVQERHSGWKLVLFFIWSSPTHQGGARKSIYAVQHVICMMFIGIK